MNSPDPYAGLVGRWYSFYIRRPRLACRVGSAMWDADFAPMYQRLAALGELPAGVTVLDAACGAGLALHWLDPSAVARYVGVDASPSMLARARKVAGNRGFRNAAFELADVADISSGDGVVDVCLFLNALHCVPDPAGAIAEVTRCLAPGGRLIGSMLIRGGSSRADQLLVREASRPNGTAGAGGTLADLERWLREADLIGIQAEHAGAMAVFEAGKPHRAPESGGDLRRSAAASLAQPGLPRRQRGAGTGPGHARGRANLTGTEVPGGATPEPGQ